MKFGFVKVATAVPRVKVADCVANVAEIKNLVMEADEKGVEVVLFPELALTGATCGDLFAQPLLHDAAREALMQLLCDTRHCNVIAVVGMPLSAGDCLLNAAVVIYKGSVLGVVPKTILNGDEKRWFTTLDYFGTDSLTLCNQEVLVGSQILFRMGHSTFSIAFSADVQAPKSIADNLALQGAEMLLIPAADNDVLGRYTYTTQHLTQQSAALLAAHIYCSSGFGESTTDTVYAGNAFILEKGKMLAQSERFCMESQLVISEIDVELLRNLRRKSTLFSEACNGFEDKVAVSITIPYQAQPDAEFTRTFNEIQLGRKRSEALKELSLRVNHADLSAVLNAIIQAEELGVSIGELLRIQGDMLRNKRFTLAEKLANEAPVKIIIPIVLFIFPAVLIILIGPIVMQAVNMF